jgi:nicotinamidase-related amidase
MSTALIVVDVQRGFDDVWLAGRGISRIAICGITTNHCCETTARMAGNLGYETLFVLDATHAFDRTGPDGITLTADELSRTTATNLHGEFATAIDTARAIDCLRRDWSLA